MKPFKDINEHDMTFLGSILYTKRVMGSRILTNSPVLIILIKFLHRSKMFIR
jgi:hypothetical protein